MIAIAKKNFYQKRPKMFIERTFLSNMVRAVNTGHEETKFAMLWVVTYSFLLRMPSEVSCSLIASGSSAGVLHVLLLGIATLHWLT